MFSKVSESKVNEVLTLNAFFVFDMDAILQSIIQYYKQIIVHIDNRKSWFVDI